VVSNWLLRHRIDTGDCVYSGCAMRLVTEKEINQAVTMSDLFRGIVCAAMAGVAMGAWLWLCLGWGVG
jgi:predicted MFS family arabinose efflux permease